MTSVVNGLPLLAWDKIITYADNETAVAFSITSVFFRKHVTTNYSEKFVPGRIGEMLSGELNLDPTIQKAVLKFLGFARLQLPSFVKKIEGIRAKLLSSSTDESWDKIDFSLDPNITDDELHRLRNLLDSRARLGCLPRMSVECYHWDLPLEEFNLKNSGLSDRISTLYLSLPHMCEEQLYIAIKNGKPDVELIEMLTASKGKGYIPTARLLMDAIENDCSLEVVCTVCALGNLGLTSDQLLGVKVAQLKGGIKVRPFIYENDPETSVLEWEQLIQRRFDHIEQFKKCQENIHEVDWLSHQLELFTIKDPFNGAVHFGNPSFWQEKPTMNHVLHLIKHEASFEVIFHRLRRGEIRLSVMQIVQIMTKIQIEQNKTVDHLHCSEQYHNSDDKIYFSL